MKAVLEGLLFIIGDEGLTKEQMLEILEVSEEDLDKLLDELKEDYESSDRGITIKKFGDEYKLTTKSEHKEHYEKLAELSSMKTLSQSALETLAIIAYNEPITRIQIDELRGVNSSQMIRNLLARDFIKEVGRADTAGRPRLYAVTDAFLDYFGLSSIEELPKIEEEINDEEIELYNSKYKEDVEEL